jgi:type I restriction enzyme S subunit
MKATDAYRKINNSPIKGIVLYYTEQILQMAKIDLGSVISQIQTGKTPPKANPKYYSASDVNWFKPSDIGYSKYLIDAKEKFSNIAVAEKKATIYPKGTLFLIGIGGGVGRVSILKAEGSSNQQITGITFSEKVCPQYAYYYYLVREDYIKSQAKSMSFPILNQAKIKELEFKCPTVPEQNEFVKFIDACWNSFLNNETPDVSSFEISSELKVYTLKQFKAIELDDKIQKNIENELNLLTQLKQSILQEAIQGKLTADWREQNPNTEPASELLKRIKAEKNQLIKDKKIKKEKALPPITKEEIPFELPDGWVWCRLGNISTYLNGKGFNSTDFKKNIGVKCIKITNAGVGEIIETDDTLPLEFENEYSAYLVYENDIIIALTRPYIADGLKVSLCPKAYNKSLLNQRVAVVRAYSNIQNKYIYKYLRTKFVLDGYKREFDSTGQQPNLKTEHVTNLIFPLAPVEEQKAIVEKVETLLQKCTALEQEIKTSEANAQMLMQAVLKEAFEGKKEVVCQD